MITNKKKNELFNIQRFAYQTVNNPYEINPLLRNYLAKADTTGEIYSQIYSSFNDERLDLTLTIKFSKIDSKIKDFKCRFIVENRINPIPYKYRTFNIFYDFYNGSTSTQIFGPTTVQYNPIAEPEDPETTTVSPTYAICNRIYTPGNTFEGWLSNVNNVINQPDQPDPEQPQSSPKIDIEIPSYTIDTIGYIELYSGTSQVGDLIDPSNTQNYLSQISIDSNDFENSLSNILTTYLNYYSSSIGDQSTIDYALDMFRVILENPTSEYISLYNNNNGEELSTNNSGEALLAYVAIMLIAVDVQFFASNLTVYSMVGESTIDHFTTTIVYGPGLVYDKIDIVRG